MRKWIISGSLAALALAGCGSSGSGAILDQNTAPPATSSVDPGGNPEGGTSTPSAAPKPLLLPVGRSVFVPTSTLAGSGGTARVTVISIQKTATQPSEIASPLEPGHTWVEVKVSYQCQGPQACDYNEASDWGVITPDGTVATFELAGIEPMLGSGTLAQGRVVSGFLTFDAPTEANELTFGETTNPTASWQIPA